MLDPSASAWPSASCDPAAIADPARRAARLHPVEALRFESSCGAKNPGMCGNLRSTLRNHARISDPSERPERNPRKAQVDSNLPT